MKNNRIDALLRRDEATTAGLLKDQPQYAPLEDDLGPLRTAHAANLAKAQALETEVLAEDQDDSAAVKASTRTRLLALGGRLLAALQAYADSTANPDEELAGRVRFNISAVRRAEEGTFLQLLALVSREAEAASKGELAKREFTADDLSEFKRLLARFEQKKLAVRQSDVAGATARQTLEAALAANTQLLVKMRRQLRPYKGSATRHEVWLRFQGYTKVIVRGVGSGKPSGPTAPDSAPL